MQASGNKFSAVDTNRLVMMIIAHGEDVTVCTGYLIRSWLILTTSHIPSGSDCQIQARQERTGQFLFVRSEPLWISTELDAALFELITPVNNVPNWVPEFAEGQLTKDGVWVSVGYPDASRKRRHDQADLVRSSGLSGHFYVHGGRGQGLSELELTVDAPPNSKEGWSGISGAPIFIDNLLIGIIKESLASFSQQRLLATPVSTILQDRSAWDTISKGYQKLTTVKCLVGTKGRESAYEISVEPSQGKAFKDHFAAPQIVLVPPGEFMMGRAGADAIESGEGPRRHVLVNAPFGVSKYPITKAEFAYFMNEIKEQPDTSAWTFERDIWEVRIGRNFLNPGFDQTHRHPVVCVNWDMANDYCRWLTAKTGQTYRLPSEAEWEYFARAGIQLGYGASMLSTEDRHLGGEERPHRTQAVNANLPNDWGIYSLFGNIWQWVEDCWHDNYIDAPHDARSWLDQSNGDCSRKVVRGGSWNTQPNEIRLSRRRAINHNIAINDVGFRVIREITN